MNLRHSLLAMITSTSLFGALDNSYAYVENILPLLLNITIFIEPKKSKISFFFLKKLI